MSQMSHADQLNQIRKRARDSYIDTRTECMYKKHINKLKMCLFLRWKKLIPFTNIHAANIVDFFRLVIKYRKNANRSFDDIEYTADELTKLPLDIQSRIDELHKRKIDIDYMLCISREQSIENKFMYDMLPWVNRHRSKITADNIDHINEHITSEIDKIFGKNYSFLLRFPSFDSKCNIENNIAFFLRIIILCKSNIKLPYWIPFSKDEILLKSIEKLQYYTEIYLSKHERFEEFEEFEEFGQFEQHSNHQNQRCICCLNIFDSSDMLYNSDIEGYLCVKCISLN